MGASPTTNCRRYRPCTTVRRVHNGLQKFVCRTRRWSTDLLTSRVDALEDTVKDLERQMGSVNTKMDKFETMVVAIHEQLNAMKESNDKLTAQVTRLELSINSRFTEMDDKFTNLESSMESSMDSRFKKMDQSMNTQLQGMNSRVAELSSDVNSGSKEMTQKNDKTSIEKWRRPCCLTAPSQDMLTVDVSRHKNTMSRFGNLLARVAGPARYLRQKHL
ncbi:hypothetical protein E4U38_002848 [Claviceps purpurea]|nr:hypothetical protein E4U38_002848 [Claviceps purpurea]